MPLEQRIEELTGAVKTLTEQITALTDKSVYMLPEQATEEKPKKKKPAKKKAETVEESTPVATVVEEPEAPTQPTLTIDDVRQRLQPVVQQHGPASVQAALKAFGAETLSSLDNGKYVELLKAVGETIGSEV